MSHILVVTGPFACFRRPEFIADTVTYDVMPPIAARAVFEAVHWTPAIRWHVEKIEILHPIRTDWSIADGESGCRELRLVDVAYAVHAHFEMTTTAGPADNVAQHVAIFRRRAKGSRYFRMPYLGRKDCVAAVRLARQGETPRSFYAGSGKIDLGWMLHDRDPDDERRQRFFRPAMVDGVIDLSDIEPATLPS